MPPRGWNLRAGEPAGDAGRSAGGRARSEQENGAPRTWACKHCENMRYTTKAQCWGHQGFRAVMVNNPAALHSLYEKIGRTGRLDSAERWAALS